MPLWEASRRLCGFFAFSLCVLTAPISAAQEDGTESEKRTARPAGNDCFLSGLERSVDCYRYQVPLDWSAPDGETIEVFAAVIPAREDEGKEPLFLLAGGPGQAATSLAPLLNYAFERVRRTRDIVLLDQRGTGKSTPFTCDFEDEEDGTYQPFSPELVRDFITQCVEDMGVDVRHFQTDDAARDINHVRKELGYDKISLWGGSYGTRMALHYIKRFPDTVRAAVLDGITSPNLSIFTASPLYAQAAFDKLIEDCAADEDCSARFPDFNGEMPSEVPTRILMPGTDGLKRQEITLDRYLLAEAVRGVLYRPDRSAILPFALNELTKEDNPQVITALLSEAVGNAASSMATGLTYAVLCSEDFALTPEADADAAASQSFHIDTFYRPFRAGCPVFPTKPAPADYKDPVVSDLPILALSGALDPITPPDSAEAALATLSNAVHVVAPAASHGVTTHGCAPRLIADFINDPSAELDVSCLTKGSRPPFVLTASGPKP